MTNLTGIIFGLAPHEKHTYMSERCKENVGLELCKEESWMFNINGFRLLTG